MAKTICSKCGGDASSLCHATISFSYELCSMSELALQELRSKINKELDDRLLSYLRNNFQVKVNYLSHGMGCGIEGRKGVFCTGFVEKDQDGYTHDYFTFSSTPDGKTLWILKPSEIDKVELADLRVDGDYLDKE
jgi:hypothetical protein